MLKLLIFCLVAVWIAGLFLGRRRRLIKSSTQLTQVIAWLLLVFMGTAWLPNIPLLHEHLALRAMALLVWFAASYKLTRWAASRLERKP